METNKEIIKPPISNVGVIGWIRENLFSSPLNTVLTIIIASILWFSVIPFLQWWPGDAILLRSVLVQPVM